MRDRIDASCDFMQLVAWDISAASFWASAHLNPLFGPSNCAHRKSLLSPPCPPLPISIPSPFVALPPHQSSALIPPLSNTPPLSSSPPPPLNTSSSHTTPPGGTYKQRRLRVKNAQKRIAEKAKPYPKTKRVKHVQSSHPVHAPMEVRSSPHTAPSFTGPSPRMKKPPIPSNIEHYRLIPSPLLYVCAPQFKYSFSTMLFQYRSEQGALPSSPIFDKNGVLCALRTGHPAGWLSRFHEFESAIDTLQRDLPIWSTDWEVSRTRWPSPHFGYSFGGGQTVRPFCVSYSSIHP